MYVYERNHIDNDNTTSPKKETRNGGDVTHFWIYRTQLVVDYITQLAATYSPLTEGTHPPMAAASTRRFSFIFLAFLIHTHKLGREDDSDRLVEGNG